MAASGLYGPYPLTRDGISNNVTHTSPGAYALGETRDGTFYISYVGRADRDVADRLADHIGNYRQFKFDYFASAKEAFFKECRLFHMFNPPDNEYHPDRPNRSDWSCPVCDIFD